MAAMLQRASARSGGTGAHRRAFGDKDGPEFGEETPPNDGRFLTGPSGTAPLEGPTFPFNPMLSQTEIRARAQAFKKQRTLSPRSDEDFEGFANVRLLYPGRGGIHSHTIQVNCASEHMFRVYHATLENRDLLTTLSAGKAYSIPEDVKVRALRFDVVDECSDICRLPSAYTPKSSPSRQVSWDIRKRRIPQPF